MCLCLCRFQNKPLLSPKDHPAETRMAQQTTWRWRQPWVQLDGELGRRKALAMVQDWDREKATVAREQEWRR